MQLSLNWLKHYVDLSGISSSNISEALTSRGLEVESVRELAHGLEKVVVAEILSLESHPNADRLRVCQVKAGAELGEFSIVCGASNMKAGDKVALCLIGAHLPNGLTIKKSKIRGVVSEGMLASESELGLSEESEGILILKEEHELGQPISKALNLDDCVIEVSVTPNRGDCLSYFGVARELSSYFKRPFSKPNAFSIEEKELAESPLDVKIEPDSGASVFLGRIIENIQIGESPQWLRQMLERSGQRSINNIVDLTNFVLLETGHPVHAYDLAFLEGNFIAARSAKKGEQLSLLDGEGLNFQTSLTLIADEKKPLSLAGVMGGSQSQVNENTTSVFLEVALFEAAKVRKSAQFAQKKTESSKRFERSVDPEQLDYVLNRLSELILKTCKNARPFRRVIAHSLNHRDTSRKCIPLKTTHAERFLGINLMESQAVELLESVGCTVRAKPDGEEIEIFPPSFRADLKLSQDIWGELARIKGFDQIPATLPRASGFPEIRSERKEQHLISFIDRLKDIFCELGLCETIHFGFNDPKRLEQFSFKPEVKLRNPISKELSVLVPSLIPGLFEAFERNANHHFGSETLSIRLFEVRPIFLLNPKGENPYQETMKAGILLTGPQCASGLNKSQNVYDFFDVKGLFESLFLRLGIKRYSSEKPKEQPLLDIFHPGQSLLWKGTKDTQLGYFGALHPQYRKLTRHQAPIFVGEFNVEAMQVEALDLFKPLKFQRWPEFPGIERDFSLVIADSIASEDVLRVGKQASGPLLSRLYPLDVYEGSPIEKGHKSLTLRALFRSPETSLKETDIEGPCQKLRNAWEKELNAKLR